MNQAIVVNNYSGYKQVNGISATENSTSPELAKERGSEKYTRNINKLDEFVTSVPTNYQTETVDFPDSPQYKQFTKGYFQDSKVPKNSGEMDATIGASSQSNDHYSQQGSLRHIPFSSEGLTLLDSFSSDKEEYFEDDLVTGKLDSAFSISDEDMLSSEDEDDDVCELSADQLELVAKQGLGNTVFCSNTSVERNSNNIKNSRDILKALNSSQKRDILERIFTSNQDNLKNEHKQNDGFLFDERASDDAPDTSLVQKVRSCFDMDKIKDIYILSGRLQDILTPKEIEEIVTHSEIYSEFIDDDVIEMLSVARLEKINNYSGIEKSQTQSSLPDNRKIIPALRNKLNMDVIDDIKIRAVFEGHKKSGEEIVATSHSLGSNLQGCKLRGSSTSPSGDNIRAFFEESLVKSSSTLKKILPDNESLSSDIPSDLYHDEVFDTSLIPVKQPQTGVLLNVNNLEADSFLQHNCTPVLKPDGTIELLNGKNKQMALETDHTIHKVDIVNKTRWMQDPKENMEKERPMSLHSTDNIKRKKKISVNRDILASEEHDDDQRSLSSLSNKSDTDVFSPADDLVTPEDIETPDDLDESMLECAGSSPSEPIPEVSAAEELEEERSWKTCLVGGVKRKIDMKVIEPYKKVLSHGGYFGETRNAIIVFSACYLPDRSRRDYDYVMDNLFLYVLVTLDQLVAEDYVLVYLHGATQRSNMPSFGWLKRCYQMIDRRLRKNLKGLYLVHPTFWLKTIVIMTRPFVSSKFSRKLQFVNTLEELSELIPMDHVCIPSKVKELNFQRMIQKRKKTTKSKNVKPR